METKRFQESEEKKRKELKRKEQDTVNYNRNEAKNKLRRREIEKYNSDVNNGQCLF